MAVARETLHALSGRELVRYSVLRRRVWRSIRRWSSVGSSIAVSGTAVRRAAGSLPALPTLPAMRPLAASSTFLLCTGLAAASAVIHAAFLLARCQCFFLRGSDQSFHFLVSLLANLACLLLLLLRSQ